MVGGCSPWCCVVSCGCGGAWHAFSRGCRWCGHHVLVVNGNDVGRAGGWCGVCAWFCSLCCAHANDLLDLMRLQ